MAAHSRAERVVSRTGFWCSSAQSERALSAARRAGAFGAPADLEAQGVVHVPLHDLNIDTVTPYRIAGIGRQSSHNPNWFFEFGAGVEFRLQQNFGVFADLRGMF